MKEILAATSELFGVTLSEARLRQMELYARELMAWNQRLNLTAVCQADEIAVKHFLDSLSCLLVMGVLKQHRVVDVGTGAGFPGLVLKIACPQIQLTLVESISKKANFCQHVVNTLGLKDVEVLTARAEEAGRDPAHREAYDWAVARAVAHLPVLVEYLLPFVRVGGRVLAQKGESAPEEMLAAEKAIHTLGGKPAQLQEVSLPGVKGKRYLVVIEKVAPTPEKYPRRVGIPAKRPLRK